MENRYQKALDKLLENVEFKDYSNKTIHECNEAITVLQELVDKVTPKKYKIITDKNGKLILVCPNCNQKIKMFKSQIETIRPIPYCFNCGKAIKWSDE